MRGSQRATIGVFAKHWTPGLSKTRLAADLDLALAADVSKLLTIATLERTSRLPTSAPTRRVLAFAPPDKRADFERLAHELGGEWQIAEQAKGDLGARISAFFDACEGPAILLGSDAPHFPEEAVLGALTFLAEATSPRAVFGPSEDGGYWLIGFNGPRPDVLTGAPWSEPDLFATTESRLQAAGWRLGVDYETFATCYDIDRRSDLDRLRQELAGAPHGDPALADLSTRLDELLGPPHDGAA